MAARKAPAKKAPAKSPAKKATAPKQEGGFWDEYVEIGGNFIGAEEKQTLMDNGVPLAVQTVVRDEHNSYGDRYVAQVIVPNPETGADEERSISFPIGTVESRDRMLSQMAEYMERDDAKPVVIKLEKVGRSIIIRQA